MWGREGHARARAEGGSVSLIHHAVPYHYKPEMLITYTTLIAIKS